MKHLSPSTPCVHFVTVNLLLGTLTRLNVGKDDAQFAFYHRIINWALRQY